MRGGVARSPGVLAAKPGNFFAIFANLTVRVTWKHRLLSSTSTAARPFSELAWRALLDPDGWTAQGVLCPHLYQGCWPSLRQYGVQEGRGGPQQAVRAFIFATSFTTSVTTVGSSKRRAYDRVVQKGTISGNYNQQMRVKKRRARLKGQS